MTTNTTTNSERPVVAYYRLSAVKENGRELGIDAQKSIVHHYFKNRIIKEFKEIKSAKNLDDRPVLLQAIQYSINNECVLAVARLDRLSRNVDDCRNILNQLGTNLRSCDIPGEIDRFSLTLFAAFAERERALIALRTSQALKAKKNYTGKWQKSNPAFKSGKVAAIGRATNTKHAKENPHNRRAAGIIHIKYGEGKNFKQIADYLNENGFCAPKGGKFSSCQVKRIHQRY